MVSRQHDNCVKSDVDKNLQRLKMYLYAKFGCSTPDGLEGVCSQRNEQTNKQKPDTQTEISF